MLENKDFHIKNAQLCWPSFLCLVDQHAASLGFVSCQGDPKTLRPVAAQVKFTCSPADSILTVDSRIPVTTERDRWLVTVNSLPGT